jgi:gamma-polyglutamate biosynthesis protein CapA
MRYVFLGGLFILAVLIILLPLPTYEVISPVKDKEPVPETRIIFGGDMMFDRYIRHIMAVAGGDYVFSCIDHILLGADMVMANLEGPITHFESVSVGTDVEDPNNYQFTFPPEVAPLLARRGIAMVNIGNNHIFDFGQEGAHQTKEYLTRADIAYTTEGEPLEIELQGVPLTIISYNQFSYGDADTSAYIQSAREGGRVPVVYAHWGDEYQMATEKQRALARQFVDAGALLVVGSHPHIVQEVERYRDVSIYYSLGNFIFDQYFSEEVTNGLLLSVTFTAEGVKTIQEVPIKLHPDGRTCVADPVER